GTSSNQGAILLFEKPTGTATFGAPIEFTGSGRFGSSVAIQQGTIVVGAPALFGGRAYVFEQPKDLNGFPLRGPNNEPTDFTQTQVIAPVDASGSFGISVSYDYLVGIITMCGPGLCQFFTKEGVVWSYLPHPQTVGDRAFQYGLNPQVGFAALGNQSSNSLSF